MKSVELKPPTLMRTPGKLAAPVDMLPKIAADRRSSPLQYRFNGFSVLFVEDDIFNQQLTGLILSRTGCHLCIAGHGREALDLIKENRFDIVLMDISMPVMDGIETTKIIREELGLTIPIIAVTGDVLAEDIRAYNQVGMNAHLAKPYSQSQLLTLISRWYTE